MTEPKTCLVIGAGAGIGGTVGKKFAEEGYHAALCRRSDIDGLNGMVEGLQGSGLSASGHLLNAVEEGALESLIEEVEAVLFMCSTAAPSTALGCCGSSAALAKTSRLR